MGKYVKVVEHWCFLIIFFAVDYRFSIVIKSQLIATMEKIRQQI